MMVGIRGVPLTESFEWCKWRRTKSELRALGATEIVTDKEAKRRGLVVAAVRSCAEQLDYPPQSQRAK